MGKWLIKDYTNQKKYISGVLLLTIIAAAVGFAFRSIYDCVGIIFTAGISFVYINSFFDLHKKESGIDQEDDDRILRILREKVKVRAKYVEIICLVAVSYILMSVAYIANVYDTGIINDPEYSIYASLEQIALYPFVFMLTAAVITPVLVTRINRIIFVILALFSMIIPYGVFLLDFFTGFIEIKQLMTALLFIIPGITIISYFISMVIVIRRK